MEFKSVTQRDLARLRRYYKDCSYGLCEYSAMVKLMWREHLHPAWAEAGGCLVVRNCIDGKYCFDYPVPGRDGDEDAALDAIERWCMEQGVQPEISVVPAEKTPRLLARYPLVRVSNVRSWRDYVYAASDLRDFPGRHYAGQRNHINKFRSLFPDARFRTLGAGDEAAVEEFFREYERLFTKQSMKARRDLRLSKKMMRLMDRPYFLCGGLEVGGKLISIALAERCGETLHIHIEKAL